MNYELVWHYVDDPPPPIESEPYIHFSFMLRYPDVPPGKGHTTNFCFNVLQKPESNENGVRVVRRGFLDSIPYSQGEVKEFVEAAVKMSANNAREDALNVLNSQFINSDLDFSEEFLGDLMDADDLLRLVEEAFDGVSREGGISLHQALVIDNYGTQEEFETARNADIESSWQNVSESVISENTSVFCFLDPIGFRYYLPAYMSWSVRNYENDDNDTNFYTYLAIFPSVAPREVGRGIGAAFDLAGFITEHSFTERQISAIYRFLCFMAIKGEFGLDEDQYEVAKKWRAATQVQ